MCVRLLERLAAMTDSRSYACSSLASQDTATSMCTQKDAYLSVGVKLRWTFRPSGSLTVILHRSLPVGSGPS